MTLAGTPPIIKLSPKLLVTTAPAATTQLSPIETPCKITLLEPIHNYYRLSLHNSTLKWI